MRPNSGKGPLKSAQMLTLNDNDHFNPRCVLNTFNSTILLSVVQAPFNYFCSRLTPDKLKRATRQFPIYGWVVFEIAIYFNSRCPSRFYSLAICQITTTRLRYYFLRRCFLLIRFLRNDSAIKKMQIPDRLKSESRIINFRIEKIN